MLKYFITSLSLAVKLCIIFPFSVDFRCIEQYLRFAWPPHRTIFKSLVSLAGAYLENRVYIEPHQKGQLTTAPVEKPKWSKCENLPGPKHAAPSCLCRFPACASHFLISKMALLLAAWCSERRGSAWLEKGAEGPCPHGLVRECAGHFPCDRSYQDLC